MVMLALIYVPTLIYRNRLRRYKLLNYLLFFKLLTEGNDRLIFGHCKVYNVI